MYDELTRKYTASNSFAELVLRSVVNGYTPTLRTESTTGEQKRELTLLANAFDNLMEQVELNRRIYRA